MHGALCSHITQDVNAHIWLKVKRGLLGDCENLSLEYSGFLIFLCDQRVKHSSRSSCAAAVKIGRRGKV